MFRARCLDYRDGYVLSSLTITVSHRLPLAPTRLYSLAYKRRCGRDGKSPPQCALLTSTDMRGRLPAPRLGTKAGGRVVRGLVNRRTRKTELCTAWAGLCVGGIALLLASCC